MPSKLIENAISVDVEDYFQVSAFEEHVGRDKWDSLEPRVEENTDRLLELFASHDVVGTFFVLGWIAERFPGLVRRIHDAGNEIGSHGYSHIRVTNQNPREFEADVVKTKDILEDTCGSEVNGFRAASFSIGPQNLWALDVLSKAGYRYSSSINPIHHDLYGFPDAPRFPFRYGESRILEIPISTLSFRKLNFPCGGGGYFRLLPYAYTRWAISRINDREGKPAVFYTHPWEIDPYQPKQKGLRLKTRIRHYMNLHRTEQRLRRLLKEFRWNRMDNVFLNANREDFAPDDVHREAG